MAITSQVGQKVKALFSMSSNNPAKTYKEPLINETTSDGLISFISSNGSQGLPQTSNSPVDYKGLWDAWHSSPECIACCDTIITDVISDGYTIEPIKKNDNKAVSKAYEFLESNQFKTYVLPSHLLDELVTGDAYIYKRKPSLESYKKKVKALVRTLPLNNKEEMQEYLYYSLKDEDTFRTKTIIPVSSSTVTFTHDKFGNVQKYLQKVGENPAEFNTDEIIHFRYLPENGKLYSGSPMKAILMEVELIALIKDDAAIKFDQGGKPAGMYVFEQESPLTDNVKALKEQLKSYSDGTKKYMDLVATGLVKRFPFENISADMGYKELLEQMTRIIYSRWGVPPSKLGQSGQDSGAYDSGLSTEGYYRRIATLQDKIYSQYNSQLMIPEFGVRIIPNKSYLQDERKEVEIFKQKMDVAQQAWKNNWWNDDAVTSFLQIPKDFKGTFEQEEEIASPFRQSNTDKQSFDGSTSKQEINKMRSNTEKDTKVKAQYSFTKAEKDAIEFNEQL